jgi:hypothetical protein
MKNGEARGATDATEFCICLLYHTEANLDPPVLLHISIKRMGSLAISSQFSSHGIPGG